MLISHSLQLFVLNVAIASVLCMVTAFGLSRAFRSLPKRYATLMAGMFACLLAPLVVMLGTLCSLGQLPAVRSMDQAALIKPSVNEVALPQSVDVLPAQQIDLPAENDEIDNVVVLSIVETDPLSSSTANHEVETNGKSYESLGPALLIVWFVGIVGLTLVYARKLWLCRRFVSACRPIADSSVQRQYARLAEQLGIVQPIRLLQCDVLPTPIVVGILRPQIILPTDIEFSLTENQLHSVLTHELSHIARNDHWAAAMQTVVRIIYWWNPLVHWMSRRASELREMICDDIATSSDIAPKEYAHTIIQMAERTAATRELVGSLGISLSPISELERRLRRIIAHKSKAVDLRISKRFAIGLSALSGLLGTGLLFAQVPQIGSTPLSETSKENAQNQPLQITPLTPSANDQSEPAPASNQPMQATKANRRPKSITGTVIDSRGMPVPNAEVMIQTKFGEPETKYTASADGQFKIALDIDPSILWVAKLSARSPDGRQLGYHRFRFEDPNPVYENIEIVVDQLRDVHLRVIDSAGVPIADAKVALQLSLPHRVGPVITDSQGKVTVKVPQSEGVVGSMAWKDGAGLDYRFYVDDLDRKPFEVRSSTRFPEGKIETLKLEGAVPLKLRIIDTQTKPLAKSRAYVSLVKKPDQPYSNLGIFSEFLMQQSIDGSVSFDWFPVWQRKPIQVVAHADGYLNENVSFDPKLHEYTMIAAMRPATKIYGKITYSDGRPAPNIPVTAQLQGAYDARTLSTSKLRSGAQEPLRASSGPESFSTKTNGSGYYEVFVEAGASYSLSTYDEQWIAPALANIQTHKDAPALERNFVLNRGTRLYGRLLSKSTGEPISDMVVLKQTSGFTDERVAVDSRMALVPSHQKAVTANSNGAFEFFVGNGEYELSSPEDTLVQRVSVNGQTDLKVDLYSSNRDVIELAGTVVIDADDRAAIGANIQSVSRNLRNPGDWTAVTDGVGKFDAQRYAQAACVRAISADGRLGAITNISAHTLQIEMRLVPLGSVTGRLISPDDYKPIANQTIEYGIQIQAERGTGTRYQFGGSLTTNADGVFKISDLVPGWEYQIIMQDTVKRNLIKLPITKVRLEPGQSIHLGDVRRPPAPNFRPYNGSDTNFAVPAKEAEPDEKAPDKD